MNNPSSHKSSKIAREVFKSPGRLVISLILGMFVIDIGITFLLRALPISYKNVAGLLDSLLLVILIGPLLYFLVFRPVLKYLVNNIRLQKEDQILYEITEGMTSTSNLEELLKLIHESISKVLYAENCFFALYDDETARFSFPYFVDKYDDPPAEDLSLEKSCTAYIFKKGKSMLIPGDVFLKLVDEGEVELVGSFSPSWVGIPLKASSKTIGVMVLQHYEEENVYDEGHLRFLDSIASQVANVIERKRAEEELERSVSLLAATLEAVAEGIAVVDKSMKITHYNQKFVEMWEIPESLLKERDGNKLKPFMFNKLNNPDEYENMTRQIYKDEEKTSFDYLEFADGRVFERYSQPQRSGGKVVGRVWTYRDITEKRKAHLAVRESEEKFRTIFEQSPVGIDIYDGNGRLADINKAALDMFGIVDKNDVLGNRMEEGTSLNQELLEELYQGKQIEYTASFDFDKIREIGQFKTTKVGKVTFHYVVTPLKSVKEGKILSYLVVVQNITERLKAEQELREKEARYRTLFESANDAIFIMERGRFVNCNRMALQIFECETKEDFIGFSPWEFSPEYQPDGRTSENSAKEKIENAYKGIPQRFYWKHTTKKGRLFDAEVVLNRVEINGTYHLQAVVRDITERKQAENLLMEKEARLRELNADKDKFFSIIAHDLKSPFNAILGFSDLLNEKIKEKDYNDIEELVGFIHTSSERAMNLSTSLLDWARSQTDTLKFEPDMIPVSDVINEVLDSLKDVANQKSIDINVEISGVDMVYADKVMLSTVLRNLVSNAIKFSNIGGKITLSVENNAGMVLFKVRDQGVGMDKKGLEKLFRIDESFSQPGTLNEKGTGLGLLICKEFVEKQGGHIWAKSEVGKGSTFSFTIPKKNNPGPK